VLHITEALGRVLAEDIRAKCSSPQKDLAAIDGYAMLAASAEHLPASLRVIGESTSSHPFLEEIRYGEAVKVYSGALIPCGADTNIALYNVTEKEGDAIISEPIMQGQNICYAGFDFAENEVLLHQGSAITARDIGLSASMHVSWLPVRRRPKVGVLAIGDELAMLEHIYDGGMRTVSSSSLVISSFITACGGVPVNLGIATDSKTSIERMTQSAKGVDLLITTGGLSASADNLLRNILTKGKKKPDEVVVSLAREEHVLYGEESGIPLLAFPGSPISTQICCALFLRPAIEHMLGVKRKFYKKTHVVLGRDLDIDDKKMDFIFAKLTEGEDRRLIALPASSYDRQLLSALAEADCLITVDPENTKRGSIVEMTRFVCSVLSG